MICKKRRELALKFPKCFHIKTFNVKSEHNISPLAKSILQSLQFKHFYYALDDISYLLNPCPIERDFFLQIFSSVAIFVQNNLSINFFDMWIHEIYITEVSTPNKFLRENSNNKEFYEYITIKLAYSLTQEKK